MSSGEKLEIDILKVIERQKQLCIDLRFDASTRLIRATEVSKRNKLGGGSVVLKYMLHSTTMSMDDSHYVQARLEGEYADYEQMIESVKEYLGKPISQWKKYVTGDYFLAISAQERDEMEAIDWLNWFPLGNTIIVPRGAVFSFQRPQKWLGVVRLIN